MKRLAKRLLPQAALRLIRRVRETARQDRFRAAAPARIAAYLAGPGPHRLNVGSGPYSQGGWLNVDIVQYNEGTTYADCTQPLPFPDASFDYVFTEHMIEHIDYTHGLALLAECRRILKPGGRIRIATPNLAFLIELYRPDKSELQQRYIGWMAQQWPGIKRATDAFVINEYFRAWGHQFIYDPDTLAAALAAAGFEAIRFAAPGSSDDPELRNLERHAEAITDEFNRLETFVVEAVRPAGRS